MNLWLDFQGLPILEFLVLQFSTLIIQKGLGKIGQRFPLFFSERVDRFTVEICTFVDAQKLMTHKCGSTKRYHGDLCVHKKL